MNPLMPLTNGKPAPFFIRPRALRPYLEAMGMSVPPYPYRVPKDSTLTCDICWNVAHEDRCRSEDIVTRQKMQADLQRTITTSESIAIIKGD